MKRLILLGGLCLACGQAVASVRPPVIIVPGAPGTELYDSRSGELVWPSARLMTKKHGNTILSLPLDDPASSPIVAGGLLRVVRVAGMKFRIHAYDGLEKLLAESGYHEGSWTHPLGEGEYFYFPYDWRQSVETGGRRFSRELSAFYARCAPGTPPAIVVGHSLGGLLARYALMYGDTPLGDEGPLPPVTWAGRGFIGSIFLVATPNEGSFIALKGLEKGFHYRSGYGAFSPETLFSYPSVFDMIPKRLAPLLDDQGAPLAFNLDHPEGWERAGWSILDPRTDSAIPLETRRAHLGRELARHARLWAALDQLGSAPNPATLTVVAGWSKSVQRSARVKDGRDGMVVRFGMPATSRALLKPLLFEPGDTMVPLRSPIAESSSHDPAGSLCFSRVVQSKRAHQDLLSSPEMLEALGEVLK